MDPVTGVGVAGSIITVIQLTGALLTLTHGYIGGVSSAPRDIERLQKYLQDFGKFLEALNDHVQKNPQLTSLARLSGDGGSLEQCYKNLECFRSRLEQPYKNRSAKLIRLKSLKWPLKETEVSQFTAQMEEYKSLFNIALGFDSLSVAQETRCMVQGLQYKAIAQTTPRQEEAIRRQNMENLHIWKQDDPLGWLHMGATNTKHLEVSNARQKGTGNWFLRSPEFLELVRVKPDGSILYAYGIPGAGKTYIASLAIDHLKSLAPTKVAYIYFDYKDVQQHKPVFVLASLVKQLASQAPQVPPEIEALHETLKNEKREATLEELYTALTSFSHSFLVFDALDECQPDHQRKLLPLFKRMKKDRFSVFLTSRPHSGDIRLSLVDTPKIEISANEEDIRLYVKERLDEHPQAKSLFRNAQCYDITLDLLACTQGIFLLVRFYINHLFQKTTEGAILAALKELKMLTTKEGPGPLDFIYERAMETIYGQHEDRKRLALKVLSWLVKAKRTLTFDEIQVAVSIKPQQYELNKLDLPNRTTLLDVCAGLVTIDEHSKTVKLVHYTAQEYLLKKSRLPDNADLDIAIACTTYLSFEAFAQGACISNQDHLSRVESYPFLEYAGSSLSFHLRACKENVSTDIILKFLKRSGSIESFQQVCFLAEYHGYNFDRYPKNRTPLHIAASIGNCTVTQLLLKEGVDIWAVDSDRKTALHCAAREGHETVVRMLIEKGGGISAMKSSKLYKIMKKGRLAVIRLLTGDFGGATDDNNLLRKSMNRGRQVTLRLLTERRGYISAVDSGGNTALHWAAERGHEVVVKLLTDGGADMTINDNYGKTALHRAAVEGHDALARLLIEKGADISATENNGQTALRLAAGEGHEAVVRILLEKGADITAPDRFTQTSLHRAAYKAHEAVIRLLVEEGIDIDVLDADGDSPLHYSILYGHTGAVQLLIDLGANISIKNYGGRTALHWAAYGGSESVTQLLINMGADISAKDNDGKSALHWAAYKGHQPAIRLLVGGEADISALDNTGKTALHWAAYMGHEGVVRLLIDEGINISVLDAYGDSALHSAASKGHMPVIQLLIDNGADISIKGRGRMTALHWAASRGDRGVVQLFIEKGADILALDIDGKTALHWAADRARDSVVQLLVEKGADMSILDGDGKTALHWASYRGNNEVVRLLADRGADISALDSDGKTAFLLALENGRGAVVQLLTEKGGGIGAPNSNVQAAEVPRANKKTVKQLEGSLRK